MRRHARWVGAVLLGCLLLGAGPATAADWRWPWEAPEKKEKKEKKSEAKPVLQATEEDREMLPRLADYYQRQLDLADRGIQSEDARVRSFARKLQRESERALGILNEQSRKRGLAVKPHVRAAVSERLRQAGRIGAKPRTTPDATDLEFLRAVMSNMKEIRPEFADYKEQQADRAFAQELDRLFDDELVPDYDEAKLLHDRVRNEERVN